MNLRELVPWNRGRQAPARRGNSGDAVGSLQANINRVFEDFWRGLDMPTARGDDELFGAALPRLDVRDAGKAVEIVAELPGMSEKDIEVSVAPGALMIRGERTSERDGADKDKGYVVRERSIGVIERTVPLPDGLDLDNVKAAFRNGELIVTLPKTAEAQASTKRIPVDKA